MSYDLGLYTKKGGDIPVEVQSHAEGGTYALGGTSQAELNVTYNYSQYYYDNIDADRGIRWLYGRQAKDCIDRLKFAVTALGTTRDEDYWAKTPGNAGYALSILLEWATQHPTAWFNGD